MKYIALTSDGHSERRDNLTDAKKAAETMVAYHGKPVEIYAHIATCHPPEPQPCRWEEVGKKSDRDFDRVPLGDLPAPPEGFAYYGVGPLSVQAEDHTTDIRGYYDWSWNHGDLGGVGSAKHPYALRIGSEIAKRNGIGGVE